MKKFNLNDSIRIIAIGDKKYLLSNLVVNKWTTYVETFNGPIVNSIDVYEWENEIPWEREYPIFVGQTNLTEWVTLMLGGKNYKINHYLLKKLRDGELITIGRDIKNDIQILEENVSPIHVLLVKHGDRITVFGVSNKSTRLV